METLGTALVGGLSGLQSSLAASTSGAATGNVSMGNVAMDQQQLAPNRTSAFMNNWQHDLSGNTFSANSLTGRTAVSLLRNQGYASCVVSMRVREQDVQDASRQVDAARSESVAASTDRSAVLSEAFSKGLTKMKSTRSSTGSTSSSFEQMGQTLNRLDQITKSVADSTGLTQSQIARVAFGASGHLGLSPAVAGARTTATAEKVYQAGLSADQHKILGAMSSEQLAEFKQFGDRISRDSSYASVVSADAREARDLSTRLGSSATRSNRADASLSDRSAYSERVASARERGEVISLDIAQDPHNLAMFTRYAEQYGGTSAAARALMEAELARQSLGPNRSFSDGTGVPVTFEPLRQQHQRDASVIDSKIDVDGQGRTGEAAVAKSKLDPVASRPASDSLNDTRGKVLERGTSIRHDVQDRGEAFDQQAGPTRSDHGTLVSRRSLLKRTAKRVGGDAKESLQNAKDAVKDVFRKK